MKALELDRDEVRRLHAEGHRVRKIAGQMSCSDATIERVLREEGLTRYVQHRDVIPWATQGVHRGDAVVRHLRALSGAHKGKALVGECMARQLRYATEWAAHLAREGRAVAYTPALGFHLVDAEESDRRLDLSYPGHPGVTVTIRPPAVSR